MSSSQFTIFCIISIVLFPLHEFVDGQGLETGNAARVTCEQVKCPGIKNEDDNCYCCPSKTKEKKKCYAYKELCTRFCGKPQIISKTHIS
ncbi:hypothetical protein N665_0380s0019 [Sinapis alba]|nr:hypothetical protein N665_0380s0019 [Sinapis alba]